MKYCFRNCNRERTHVQIRRPKKSVHMEPRTYLENDAFGRGIAGHLRHRWHQAGRGRVVIVVKGDHLGQFGAVLSAIEGSFMN